MNANYRKNGKRLKKFPNGESPGEGQIWICAEWKSGVSCKT